MLPVTFTQLKDTSYTVNRISAVCHVSRFCSSFL